MIGALFLGSLFVWIYFMGRNEMKNEVIDLCYKAEVDELARKIREFNNAKR